MSYHKREFQRINDEFTEASSSLLDDASPSIDQLESVLDAYNAIVSYSSIDYEKKKKSTREFIESSLSVNRITLQRCYEKLKLPIILPAKLLSTIHYIKPVNSGQSSEEKNSLTSNSTQTETSEQTNNSSQTDQNNSKMAQTIEQFLKSASSVINYKFNGDPLKVNSFIKDAQLIHAMAENDRTRAFCLEFLKSRVEGKAEEAIPDDCDTVEKLTHAFKEKLKPDNSTVVEGKILALRLQKGDYSKFATEAEKLGEALRRSLISEDFTKAKAEEISIKRMIELCRKTARSDVVKSVLESTKYNSCKEVIATFITQCDIVRRENKEFQPNNSKKSNSKGTSYNKGPNKNKTNGDNSSNKNPNYRGNNRNQNNQNGKSQQNRTRSNRNGTEHTIRLVSGAQPSTSVEQPQQETQEQFFRLEN